MEMDEGGTYVKSCPTSSSKLLSKALALSGSRDGVCGGFMSGSSFISIINRSLAIVSQDLSNSAGGVSDVQGPVTISCKQQVIKVSSYLFLF